MFENYPELLTFKETCEALRVKDTKMYALLRNNQIKHYKGDGKYYIPKMAVIDYLESLSDNGV